MMFGRRDFIKALVALSAYRFSGLAPVSASIDDRLVKSVSLKIKYTTEIMRPPKKKDIRIWIPLPITDKEQEIKDLKITSFLPYKINNEPRFGNTMLYMETESLKKGQKISLEFHLRRKTTGIIQDKSLDPELFKTPSEWERWDEEIEQFVDKIVGSEKDPIKIGKKIYDALIDMLEYIHMVCGRGVSTLTFLDRKGRCDEYHALFRSMMMYKGIPVKWEQGIMLPYPSELKEEGEYEADCIGARSWVRFYIGNDKWFPVDVSEADRMPQFRDIYFGRLLPNRMKVSTGRGIDLVPKQKGIINTFAYTYIEAGGFPAIYGHNYRNRIRYKLLEIES